ncbi:MAG: ThiF family adenylyltransferase [Deltaproteobacteria bacterium]|nr:ThiF family adenylyltransferase [Deltaproteobacteria bacterium]
MNPERYSRQSFLGNSSDETIFQRTIGIVGVGGGGSHIVQQLSHLGFKRFVLYDPDIISISNLNRTVGATEKDIELQSKKIEIARRVISSLHTDVSIRAFDKRWQTEPEPLRECDIVLGCVDKYQERQELEVSMRRYLIPYIDIGLTVVHHEPRPPLMSGHVFLSMPGKPCMWCLGLLSNGKLANEAQDYGDTGPRPQVVWANGVLASTAVGIAIDLLTGWTQKSPDVVYLLYEGNRGIFKPHTRLNEIDLSRQCPHHTLTNVGDPIIGW